LNDKYIDFYKKIYEQYPDAKYIAQCRDKISWITSRCNFMNGNYYKYLNKKYSSNISLKQYIKKWSEIYDYHYKNIDVFFKNNNKEYLKFDITDNLDKLKKFTNLDIKDDCLGHEHKNSKYKYSKEFVKKILNDHEYS